MTFIKRPIFINSLYSFHNTVNYEIIEENSINSTLTVESTFTGTLQTEGETYHIKPVTEFFSVKDFEILLEANKVAKIEYWGWTWNKPKLIIKTEEFEEIWIFERNEPKLFKKRPNPYITKLICQNREVKYEIQLNDSSHEYKGLIGVSGLASFTDNDQLPCLLGIYLNELLIFDEMEK